VLRLQYCRNLLAFSCVSDAEFCPYAIHVHLFLNAVGSVLQTLPEAEPVWGVTSLDNLLYVLRGSKSSEHIEVYDTDSHQLQRRITVPELGGKNDIVACAHNRCAYISDNSNNCIHRVGLPNGAHVTKWPVNDKPWFLSLTDIHSVLVTCAVVRKIKEFSTDGKLKREIQLAQDVVSPIHAIQLSNGQFVVCHGERDDPVHRVCLMSSDGQVVKSFGGVKGSGSQQMNMPAHIAVDRNGFVFVVDFINHRVLLLSPSLSFVREVVSHEQLKWSPLRLWLDEDRRRLYVADNQWEKDKHTSGRVFVIGV